MSNRRQQRRTQLQETLSRRAGPLTHFLRAPSLFLKGWRYGTTYSSFNMISFEESSSESGWLEEYFANHSTGPGIWKWLHYFPVYERHLARFRGSDVRLLEIGIYSGGSLDMWKAYLGPKATIYGVDIEPSCRVYEDDRTRIFIGDQASPSFWQDVLERVPEIDIVIDDGGHTTRQQIRTLESLLPHLRAGGIYICEDIHKRTNPFLTYVDALSRNLHTANYASTARSGNLECRPSGFQQCIDSVHIYPFLVVIEMRRGRLSQLSAPMKGDTWQPFLNVRLPNER